MTGYLATFRSSVPFFIFTRGDLFILSNNIIFKNTIWKLIIVAGIIPPIILKGELYAEKAVNYSISHIKYIIFY